MPQQAKYLKIPVRKFLNMVQMGTHLRCLLFRENGDFHGRVLARKGGLDKTHDAVNGKNDICG